MSIFSLVSTEPQVADGKDAFANNVQGNIATLCYTHEWNVMGSKRILGLQRRILCSNIQGSQGIWLS